MYDIREIKGSKILEYGFTIHRNKNKVAQHAAPLITSWVALNICDYDPEIWQTRFNLTPEKGFSIYFSRKEDALAFKIRWL